MRWFHIRFELEIGSHRAGHRRPVRSASSAAVPSVTSDTPFGRPWSARQRPTHVIDLAVDVWESPQQLERDALDDL